MTQSAKDVFLIGPGYIGLEVIDRLLEDGYTVTVLVRRKEAASDLEKRGIKTVLGSLADSDTIEKQTAAHSIIIHAATADDMPSVKAVIKGIDQRANVDKQTIYIHTSGCSFLSDESNGEYKSDMIYSDKDSSTAKAMDARPDSSSHRLIDLEIIQARQRLGTKAKIFLMLPPLIYGATQHGRLTIQIPTMTRFAIKHKYAGHAGKGHSVWGVVHVRDLSYGYLTMLQWLQSSPSEVALEHPYFFCENGQEISWREIASFIAQDLYEAGKVAFPAPREIPESEFGDLFGPYSMVVIGQNARNRAERLRALGWKPEHVDVRKAFKEEELPLLLKESGEFSGYAGVAASGSG